VLNRAWGTPTQTIRSAAQVPAEKPWEELTPEEEQAVLAQLERKLAGLGENGSTPT
jgi:hypothetical protein